MGFQGIFGNSGDTDSLISEDEYHSVKSHHSEDSDVSVRSIPIQNQEIRERERESCYVLQESPSERWNAPPLEESRRNRSYSIAAKVDRLLRAVVDDDILMVRSFVGVPLMNGPTPTNEPTTAVLQLCHPLCQCDKCQKIHEVRRAGNLNLLYSDESWIDSRAERI